MADRGIAQRPQQCKLLVDPQCRILIEEVRGRDAEKLRQSLDMLQGRIVLPAGAQLPEVGSRDGGTATRRDLVRHLFVAVLPALPRVDRAKQPIKFVSKALRTLRLYL